MNNTIKEMFDRQSIRAYKDKEISKEDKELIISAGTQGPSAGNMQLYSIIDVTDKELINKLSVLCDNQPFIKEAKMVLIFLADYQKWFNAFNDLNLNPRKPSKGDLLLAIEDAMIVAQNTVNAAWSLGIGSCYIGDIMENYEEVTSLLNLPNYVYPACMVVYGYINDNYQKYKPKRVDNKYVVFENAYSNLTGDELKNMFNSRSINEEYEKWMSKFIERKYNSEFSKEMNRSAKKYINRFDGE